MNLGDHTNCLETVLSLGEGGAAELGVATAEDVGRVRPSTTCSASSSVGVFLLRRVSLSPAYFVHKQHEQSKNIAVRMCSTDFLFQYGFGLVFEKKLRFGSE